MSDPTHTDDDAPTFDEVERCSCDESIALRRALAAERRRLVDLVEGRAHDARAVELARAWAPAGAGAD
jgi:hypothetical protein